MHRSNRAAFSLMEVMIIVAILLDVAVIAMPAFLRARNMAQNTRFVNDLRTVTSAFEMYAAENHRYPAAASPGVIPAGMNVYLAGVDWTAITPVGGRWMWANDQLGATAQVGVRYGGGSANADDVRMAEIDTRIDNGALSTGGFRKRNANTYLQIIE